MKIGVFDSGIGGLTVLKKLINKYPNCEYIYYGDNKNIPFGDKSIDELKTIATNIIDFLISKDVDVIVIACGTISSNLLGYLHEKYDIPIYDIISGVVNYLNSSDYENISVFCTQRTKDSKIFEKRINKNVDVIGCSNLADLIELNDLNSIELYIKEKINNLKNKDAIVLGCTHYPLIIDIIKKYTDIPILDMADYLNLNSIKNTKYNLELYFSKEEDILMKRVYDIIKNR